MSQTDQWMDEIRKLDQLRNDKLISGEEYVDREISSWRTVMQ